MSVYTTEQHMQTLRHTIYLLDESNAFKSVSRDDSIAIYIRDILQKISIEYITNIHNNINTEL